MSGERKLDEYNKEEWWDVVQKAMRNLGKPPLSRERFEEMWTEFHVHKEARAKRLAVN